MKIARRLQTIAVVIITALIVVGCNNDSCGEIKNKLFDKDGYALYLQDDQNQFTIKEPSKVKFFVEVSGSMNGFFRANKSTEFKTDVYEIMMYYEKLADSISIMKDTKGNYSNVPLSDFREQMNAGKFGSSPNSTDMKSMISKIINNLDPKKGEVAILVSDMKFDPVEAKTADVQVSQYYTDIAKLIKDFGSAVSLVCATSDYLDSKGNVRENQSPYYYLVLGDGPQVASVRNQISTKLSENGHFVDNIETGFNYGRASFSFGTPTYCEQLDGEPSFYNCEVDTEDTCTIVLKVELQNYRWLLSDERIFKKSFIAKCLNGSDVRVSSIKVDKKKNPLVATVRLKVFNMIQNDDIIEWNIVLPDQDHSKMDKFWLNASNPNDPAKSYSLEGFCKGMFKDGNGNDTLKPNYILIRK